MNTKYSKVQAMIGVAILLASVFPGLASLVRAASTTSVLDGGIAINEILIDPNDTNNFDTDGNGTADHTDEFVEIYNLSGATIDISGFALWDAGVGNWFTFPGGTTLGAGNYAVVVCGVQTGGSLPAVSGGNLAFDAGRGTAVINNGSDNVVLYDPGADEYIQLLYNGDSADDPTADYDGFSSTATQVGPVENWGSDSDGISLVREPAGDTNVVHHNTISSNNASPGDASNPASDTAPSVVSTTPANGTTGVAVDADITVNFSEDVAVTNGWFSINCTASGIHTATVIGGPQSYTLDPGTDFDNGETCTVTIDKNLISDADTDDPPDNMVADHSFSFETVGVEPVSDVIINEVDADTPSTDSAEFVELHDGGDGNTDLTGLVLVLFNGNDDASYGAFDLDGQSTDNDGYFVLCGDAANVANCDLDVSPDTNLVQNGPDAVALYVGDATDFPDDTPVTIANLLDAIVYDTADADDAGLLVLLHTGQPQVDEDGKGYKDYHSNQRCDNGTGGQRNTDTYTQYPPTPGGENTCGAIPDFGSCGDPATFIHDVQGSGSASPLSGMPGIIVEGVVVGDFQDTATELSGFFIQEEDGDTDSDPLTSEGIFVYDDDFGVDVSVGNVVRIQGDVGEYYGLTQLSNVSNVAVCPSDGSASRATVTLPVSSLDVWEQHEGMLISVTQTLYATDNYYQGRYGQIELSVGGRLDNPTNVVAPGAAALALQELNDRSRIRLDDGSRVQNPSPAPYMGVNNTLRAGDTLSELTGVLGYNYGRYEVHPTAVVSFTRVNVRDETPPAVGGRLKVASFNVLNYFNGDGLGGGFPTSRGADTLDEFNRQRAKIITAVVTLDADIVGLMEIENDGYGPNSAVQDLVNGVNDVAGAGAYAFIDPGVAQIGTDAIAVGFIYKPGAVTPIGAAAILDSTFDPAFIDTKNRPALAQTFEENATGGRFTVVVNHLKSKGSDCDDVGDSDTGDGQGNCNLTRTNAMTVEVAWLATDPTGSGDPDFIIIGDLNAYAQEDPITAAKDAGYTDLVDSFVALDAYSYVYDGQAGYLDHAMANATLLPQVTGVAVLHINADEPAALDYNDYNQPDLYDGGPFRSSDHDPVVIGLNPVSAALTVTKYASSDPVQAGGQLTYTICVTNTGNVDLHAIVTDVLPAHVTPAGVLTWTPTITIPAGVWTHQVVVTAEMNYAGPLTNIVKVSTAEGATGIYTETSQARKLTLMVNSVGGGSVIKDPDKAAYNYGEVVILTAYPDTQTRFLEWSGDLTGSTNPVSITMDSDKVITANFFDPPPSLTFNPNPPGGTVTMEEEWPDGNYDEGEIITITATADACYEFAGWIGELYGEPNPATVTLSTDLTFEATFQQLTHTLNVNIVDGCGVTGTVTLGPPGETYTCGTVVTLTASLEGIGMFLGWSGDLTGSDNPATLHIDSDKVVTATFFGCWGGWTFPTDIDGGTISTEPPQPPGGFVLGTVVTVTATPDYCYQFNGWTGDLAYYGTQTPVVITVTGWLSFAATFSRIEYADITIVIDPVGAGTVELDPATGPYICDVTPIAATATPTMYWAFDHWSWSGILADSSDNPAVFTLDENSGTVLNAHFTQYKIFLPVVLKNSHNARQ